MSNTPISQQTLRRLPMYLSFLKSLPAEPANVSATFIAQQLGLHQVQVRKDLASVSSGGRPKTGYIAKELIADIERFLGYDDAASAVLVGVGHLGRALLSYEGFHGYGLNIVAAFDADRRLVDTKIAGKTVFSMERLPDLCDRLKAHIGIITVPAEAAQAVCDRLVESGVLAIWNFAPVHLTVPAHILVQNENMAASLAVLSNHLRERLEELPPCRETG